MQVIAAYFQVLCEQPTLTTLPTHLEAPCKGLYSPVLHYGFAYNQEKLDQLRKAHLATDPRMQADELYVLGLIRKIMHPGYMKVTAPTGMDVGEEMVNLFSIATNYYPWVEEDKLKQIRKLLVESLGEPRWHVDPLFSYWKKGPFYDDDVAILPQRPLRSNLPRLFPR